MHTGKVRAEPLRCHPETRQAIILDIVTWIEDISREKNILWLLGPAGIGKSAIAMSVAEKLDEPGSKAKVAGSFFFFANDSRRSDFKNLVLTLAYGLSVWMEDVGLEIDKVLRRDSQVMHATLETQWRRLIVDTVRAVANVPPAVIIIDGLDECGGAADQRRILDLIGSCASDFPLAFLIASRPEPHLANAISAEPLSSLCRQSINLANCRDSAEMRLFIKSSFFSIYTNHRDILQLYAKNGVWPSNEDIDLITSRSDGQYIYPATLFKIVKRCLNEIQVFQAKSADYLEFLLNCWRYSRFFGPNLPESLLSQLMDLDLATLAGDILVRCWIYQNVEQIWWEISNTCSAWNNSLLASKYGMLELPFMIGAHSLRTYFTHSWKDRPSQKSYPRGACPLSWNALLALVRTCCGLVSADVRLSKGNLYVLDHVLNWRKDDIVLASLAILVDNAILQTLTHCDIYYLRAWSHAWASPWEHRESSMFYELDVREPILNLLLTLPQRYHYHELNATSVVAWLTNHFPSEYELVAHWQAGECYLHDSEQLERRVE
ncbi:hypothetical protein AX16_007826 [Volvariella volvacea WC 439]|nr:hypothetical protein AX16_007826 [Volvariella volvacea WC 439]